MDLTFGHPALIGLAVYLALAILCWRYYFRPPLADIIAAQSLRRKMTYAGVLFFGPVIIAWCLIVLLLTCDAKAWGRRIRPH